MNIRDKYREIVETYADINEGELGEDAYKGSYDLDGTIEALITATLEALPKEVTLETEINLPLPDWGRGYNDCLSDIKALLGGK
jgi:hypothetical protein